MSTQRPILFSGPMVRAILEGRKTQTRRIVKPQPDENGLSFMKNAPLDWREDVHGPWLQWKGETPGGDTWNGPTPYLPGLNLWVRETHLFRASGRVVDYRADIDPVEAAGFGAMYGGWKPSIFLPRWASRINLEVTGVRVERLCDISEEDAIAEGIDPPIGSLWSNYVQPKHACGSAVQSYHSLWDSINGHESWDANPFVWVVTFNKFIPQT
jgi:hypothetical protein